MKEAKVSGLKKHLPNILSCTRIAGTFSLPFLLWRSWERDLTLPFIERTFPNVPVVWLIVYIILASTDKIDGTLARKWKVESTFGASLDVFGDLLLLVMGATISFVWFVRDNLGVLEFRIYLGAIALAVSTRIFVFILSKIYHGKGNLLHSYSMKAFSACGYIAIFFWAFLRTIPPWSIIALIVVILYGTVDESIYITRTATYDVNFKGHGFQKYKKRADITK